MLSHLSLNQYNYLRYHNYVTLDLVLSNVDVNVSNNPDLILSIDKHHPALNVSLNCNTFEILPVYESYYYDLKNCDFVNIIKYFSNYSYTNILVIFILIGSH